MSKEMFNLVTVQVQLIEILTETVGKVISRKLLVKTGMNQNEAFKWKFPR